MKVHFLSIGLRIRFGGRDDLRILVYDVFLDIFRVMGKMCIYLFFLNIAFGKFGFFLF